MLFLFLACVHSVTPTSPIAGCEDLLEEVHALVPSQMIVIAMPESQRLYYLRKGQDFGVVKERDQDGPYTVGLVVDNSKHEVVASKGDEYWRGKLFGCYRTPDSPMYVRWEGEGMKEVTEQASDACILLGGLDPIPNH